MRKHLIIIPAIVILFSCHGKKDDSPAEQLYSEISTAYEEGRDSACLQTIAELRAKYPDAVEQRKKALDIYQKASLRLSQHDLERTMRALDDANATYYSHKKSVDAHHQAGTATASELSSLTVERIRRDSLQVRYDVLCAQIRYIHKRQKQR